MGEPGSSFLGRLHTDIALIGAQSASGDMLTDGHVEMASLKQAMMRAARRRILLIDSWKFGGPGICNVASLNEFDEVITDDGLSAANRENLEKSGVALTVVSAGDSAELRSASTVAAPPLDLTPIDLDDD
jgi:DeoR/GlpR family transcriptional regulator of sugar metabolism